VERHNNNRPISASELNASSMELGMMSFRTSGVDMRCWTELKTVRVDNGSSSQLNSLQKKKKKSHHIAAGSNGSLRRGPYVTCSNDELDRVDFEDKGTKIFPKEHYRGSRKHSLNRKRTSMGDG